MKVILEPEFQKRDDLVKVVRAAIPLVEKLLGKSASRVTVEFDLVFHEGHREPLVSLTVSDELASRVPEGVSEEMHSATFANPEAVKDKISRLWAHLMDAALERSLEYLKANVPTE